MVAPALSSAPHVQRPGRDWKVSDWLYYEFITVGPAFLLAPPAASTTLNQGQQSESPPDANSIRISTIQSFEHELFAIWEIRPHIGHFGIFMGIYHLGETRLGHLRDTELSSIPLSEAMALTVNSIYLLKSSPDRHANDAMPCAPAPAMRLKPESLVGLNVRVQPSRAKVSRCQWVRA